MTFPLISFMLFLGQSSFQETLCYQKPVVAIPVTGDQPINAREAEHLGIGISHYYSTMDEEQLYQARYFSRFSIVFTGQISWPFLAKFLAYSLTVNNNAPQF